MGNKPIIICIGTDRSPQPDAKLLKNRSNGDFKKIRGILIQNGINVIEAKNILKENKMDEIGLFSPFKATFLPSSLK